MVTRTLLMRYSLFIVALICCAYNLQAQEKTAVATPPAIDYKQVGAPMPHFLLDLLDSIKFITIVEDKEHSARWNKKHPQPPIVTAKMQVTEKDVDNGANLLIMLFNPSCSHCVEQAERFEKNIALFKRSKIVMMTNPNMQDYLVSFIRDHHTTDYAPFIVGMDNERSFTKETFLYSALPQINIYSPDRKLIRSFAGEVSIDTLKQYIQ